MPVDPKREPPRPSAKPGMPLAGHPAAAETAKAALRRLALSKLEPTPENYARAWSEEGGAAMAAPVAEPAVSAQPGARGKQVFERLAARLFDDPAEREALAQALLQSDWETSRSLADRAADAHVAQ